MWARCDKAQLYSRQRDVRQQTGYTATRWWMRLNVLSCKLRTCRTIASYLMPTLSEITWNSSSTRLWFGIFGNQDQAGNGAQHSGTTVANALSHHHSEPCHLQQLGMSLWTFEGFCSRFLAYWNASGNSLDVWLVCVEILGSWKLKARSYFKPLSHQPSST